jgi:hypothetical protein
VVTLVLGEVVPVANTPPPVKTLYHRMELPLTPGVAIIVPLPHTDVLVAIAAAGMGLTVMTTLERDCVSHVVVVLKEVI